MEQMRRTIAAAVIIVSLGFLADVAQAQRRGEVTALKEQVSRLEAEVAELRQAVVQVPTAVQAVEEISERIAAMRVELDTIAAGHRAIPDTVALVDDVALRVRALESEIASLRTALASLEQPSHGGGGGAVAYRNGFNWTSEDGDFALALGGLLQGRLATRLSGGVDDVLETGYSLPRARLSASGHAGSTDLTYSLLFDLTRSTPALDVFADYRFRDELVLKWGQYKTHFTRSAMTLGRNLVFPERPAAVANLAYDRDIGVGVHGRLASERLDYYFGLSNGGGANRLNDNIDMLIVARLDGVVLGERFANSYGDLAKSQRPTVMVGAGVAHDLVGVPAAVGEIALIDDVDGDGERDNVRVVSASADVVFRHRGLEVAVEGVMRHEQWGTIIEGNPDLAATLAFGRKNRTYLGFFGQATYLLPKQILVGGRVAHSRVPFLGVGGRDSALPMSSCADRCDAVRLLELDALVQLYNKRGQRIVGLQYSLLNFNAKDGADFADDKEHRVIVEGQVQF
jgi:prefoldin subunit 5